VSSFKFKLTVLAIAATGLLSAVSAAIYFINLEIASSLRSSQRRCYPRRLLLLICATAACGGIGVLDLLQTLLNSLNLTA